MIIIIISNSSIYAYYLLYVIHTKSIAWIQMIHIKILPYYNIYVVLTLVSQSYFSFIADLIK